MNKIRIPSIYRSKQLIKNTELFFLSKKMDIKPLQNFLIFSDPRGGSTWLSELIQKITNTAIIWEPLAINKVNTFNQLNFGWRQYIPEGENWQEAKEAFEKVFKGQVLNCWTTYATNSKELIEANQLLVKFCRGNALLPWLTNQFNFKYKPIYLIRHPFAVVSSQLKQGGWDCSFQGFQIPKTPYNEIYSKHSEYLKSLRHKEEALTATWCITNQIPLQNKRNNQCWLTLNYEELLLNPKKSLERILDEWEIDYNLEKLDFIKASKTTIKGSPIKGISQLEFWKHSLNKEQIARMNDVLNYFQINAYSIDTYPIKVYNYG